MVDPRIYRAGLALVAVAVIVFGFSLQVQPGADHPTLPPGGFSGSSAYHTMLSLAKAFPHRRPGSVQDSTLAADIAHQIGGTHGFTVTTGEAVANTADGQRTLATVVASRTGLAAGTIVILSHRDSEGSPATADLSGTAVLLQLAHALSNETVNHSLMLVSTSGSVGAAGAVELAQSLAAHPIDAVIVLGDLAGAHASQPIVVPWSNGQTVAPPVLRHTLAATVAAEAGLETGSTDLGGQFAHLAFPLTTTEQGPFGRQGIPAVLLSVSGYRTPAPNEAVSAPRIAGLGAAVLQTINALDVSPPVPAPTPYLVLSDKTVPEWAVRLLVLALILPVALATVDALARARRRGHSIVRWLAWALAGAAPFCATFVGLLLVRFLSLLPATPPGPVAGGVPIHAAAVSVLVGAGVLLVASFLTLRPICIRAASGRVPADRQPETPAGDGAAVGLMLITSLTALAIWTVNPFAAALAVPALHFWLWLAQPSVRARRPVTVVLSLLGIVPALLVVAYYAHSLGLSPLGVAWTGVLLVAGGQLTVLAGMLCCVRLGCAASALLIAIRGASAAPAAAVPLTVRGPATYAGPGSLGGTESALGQRR